MNENLNVSIDMPMEDFDALGMDNLEICFNSAKAVGAKYVGVLIEMEGFSKSEVIINPTINFDSKLSYYKSAYDESLNHKFAKGIKIIGFTYGDTFAEIENDLMN